MEAKDNTFKKWLLGIGRFNTLESSYEKQEISGLEVKNIKEFMGVEMSQIALFTVDRDITSKSYSNLCKESSSDNRFKPMEMRNHTHSYKILKGSCPIVFCCHPNTPRRPLIMIKEKDLSNVLVYEDILH